MRNFNKLAVVASSVALSVGATGCKSCGEDDNSGSSQKVPISEQATENIPVNDGGNDISAEYFSDGTRKINFSDSSFGTILDFCDGPDFVEEIQARRLDSNFIEASIGNSISRSPAHPACADGKLTPDDFVLPFKQR